MKDSTDRTDPSATQASPSLRVRVPASTSNLGPGFDQLGLALELYLEVDMTGPIEARAHRLGRLSGTASDWPSDDNLCIAAFDARMRQASMHGAHFRFDVHSEIPLCRGLGSSGAAVAAGLLLADAWCARQALHAAPASLHQLAQLGLALEGHPDNVTVSLFGGCTLGIPLADGSLTVIRQALHERFVFSVVWPSTILTTASARAALPKSYALEDVVWNTRRLSMLLEGLRSGDPQLLRLGSEDRLHTPYRLPLISGAERALAAALDAGAWMSAISGSGSALIAVHDEPSKALEIAAAMSSELAREHAHVESRCLRAARQGAQLLSDILS